MGKGGEPQTDLLGQLPDAKSALNLTVTNIASSNLMTASTSLTQVS